MNSHSTAWWMRLAGCALVAGCGPSVAGSGAPVPARGAECAAGAVGEGYPAALLRIGCDGGVVAGRADWSREGGVVTLEFAAAAAGPVGVDLVSAWPPLGEPPWLGHRIENITVLSGGRVQVRFGASAEGALDEPERVFADPRLSGVALAVEGGGVHDVRDAIDAGSRVLTRHDASVEYARSLGRPVRLVAFDRLYMVVFAGAVEAEEAREVGGAIGADWVEWGAPGARRLTGVRWSALVESCGGGAGGDEPAARRARRDVGPASATVSYAGDDRAAGQIAERIVSMAMRGDRAGALVQALAGTAGRLAVQPRVRPGTGSERRRAATDVAAVVAVHGGPGHPCSLHAEVLRELAGWEPWGGAPGTNVVLVGETALFETSRP
ncbi:MAG: hypothetical protein F4X15_00075 [Gemmatimonadetes bacterium]|nr:hypothetical protein [Gemmatimonadota bacterium]